MSNFKTNLVGFKDWSKLALKDYAAWLNTLSWKRFAVFVIVTCILSGILQDMVDSTNFLPNLTALFIFASIGIKALYNKNKDAHVTKEVKSA